MRILQVSLTYAPAWHFGGPPRVMLDYARSLQEAGHTVEVLTSECSRPAPGQNWDSRGMAIKYLKETEFGKAYYFNNDIREIVNWCVANLRGYDVIHFSQTRCLLNAVLLCMARRYNVPWVMSSFGSLPRRNEGVKTIYDAFFVRPLIRRASRCLAQTNHEAELYRSFGCEFERVEMLPLAVDMSQVPVGMSALGLQFRKRFSIPESDRLIIFLGRLHPKKIDSRIIESFAIAHAKCGRLRLAIVGSEEGAGPSLRSKVNELGIQDSVVFCGPLFADARWGAYAAADLFTILPSHYEETSLASLEALASGAPVLVNECADIPWLLNSGAGVCIAPGDVAEAAKQMVQFGEMTDESLAKSKMAARSFASDNFAVDVVGRRLVHILEKVASKA